MNGRLHTVGDLVGDRYEITRYIGEGGMQEVYCAQDTVLERDVALKAPKNPSAEKRFKRSAVLSAKVNHPHVAKTLDYFEETERPYLIEEFIDGRDLQKALMREFFVVDPYLAARLLHHLAKGIAASHHVGVVHRDLKPSNIMVQGGFSLSALKITDFGIAKMAEEELAEAAAGGEASITGSKTMVGALPYMAPEMIENPREADTPADVWALGAMMYEVLSGEKPFGAGLKAVPRIISAETPPKPRYIDSNVQFAQLGNELIDIINSCLEKDPDQRPSADDLVKRCENLCYPIVERRVGFVREIMFRSWGFIACSVSGCDVFFHFGSVYGPRPSMQDRVCYAAYPGKGADRAHPVVLLREE